MKKSLAYTPSEDNEQEAIVQYCLLRNIPIVHIPNEGKRTAAYAAKLKRMGLQPGFPDIFIPLARKGYHGLFIELKVGNNKPSREQKDWLARLSSEGYATAVAWGFDEAKKIIDKYVKED